MDIDIIKQIAIGEVLNPTFELTKQYLQSNCLCFENNLPYIEDVEINKDKNTAAVYFPIKKEQFYFVIYVENLEVEWMGMSAGNRVYLFANSEEISTEQIVDFLGFEPTEKWNMNDPIGCNSNFKHKNNGIMYEPIHKMTGEVETKLGNLLDNLLPYKEAIIELSHKASIEIQVTYYGHKDQMWGINLDAKTIKKLSELELAIDVDLYAGGNDIE